MIVLVRHAHSDDFERALAATWRDFHLALPGGELAFARASL